MVLYAAIYGDVPMVVNLSGRFYLEKGIEERLGKEFMGRINKEGYIDVMNKSGKETCMTFYMHGYFLNNSYIPYVYPISIHGYLQIIC